MPFATGETGIVVAVPEAEALVAPWRARYDTSAAVAMPAHVTLLYPFAPADLVDAAVMRRLGAIFAQFDAFEVTFSRVARFPDAVLYLEPDPDEPFRAMTRLIHRFWPEHPPYAGAHDDVVPHLTVAEGPDALLDQVEPALTRGLPVRGTVTEARLFGFDGRRFSLLARLPLRNGHGG